MNKLSLKMKLGVGFGVLLVMMAAVGVVNYRSMQKLAELSDLTDKKASAATYVRSAEALFNAKKGNVRGFLLSGDEGQMTKYEESTRKFAETLDALEKTLTTEEGRKMFAELRQTGEAYDSEVQRVVQLQREGKKKEAIDLLFGPQITAQRTAMEKTVTAFAELQEKKKAEARGEQSATESRTSTLTMWLVCAGLVIGVLVAVFVVRSITGGIARMVALIQEIAANNLAIADMEITSQDEIGKAGTALNQMKNNLAG